MVLETDEYYTALKLNDGLHITLSYHGEIVKEKAFEISDYIHKHLKHLLPINFINDGNDFDFFGKDKDILVLKVKVQDPKVNEQLKDFFVKFNTRDEFYDTEKGQNFHISFNENTIKQVKENHKKLLENKVIQLNTIYLKTDAGFSYIFSVE